MKLSSLNKGLVGHWTMSQDSLKGSLLADKTPYENDGTIYGATFATDRMGQPNKCMSFDGVDDYILTSFYPSSLTLGQRFTWTIWKKYNQFISNTGSSGNAGAPRLYTQLNDDNGTLRIAIGDSYWAATALGKDKIGKWIFISFIFDEGTVYTYINGERKNKHSGVIFSGVSESPFSLGRGWGYERFHNGSIDDVRIYNRALSETEIKTLYNSYNPKIVMKTSLPKIKLYGGD